MKAEIRTVGVRPSCPTPKGVVGQIGQVTPASESYESDNIGQIGQGGLNHGNHLRGNQIEIKLPRRLIERIWFKDRFGEVRGAALRPRPSLTRFPELHGA